MVHLECAAVDVADASSEGFRSRDLHNKIKIRDLPTKNNSFKENHIIYIAKF